MDSLIYLDKWCPSLPFILKLLWLKGWLVWLLWLLFIRVNNPTLNNNVGKFNLPHIWDRVLINTPGFN